MQRAQPGRYGSQKFDVRLAERWRKLVETHATEAASIIESDHSELRGQLSLADDEISRLREENELLSEEAASHRCAAATSGMMRVSHGMGACVCVLARPMVRLLG